jgi:hypothetical protein
MLLSEGLSKTLFLEFEQIQSLRLGTKKVGKKGFVL